MAKNSKKAKGTREGKQFKEKLPVRLSIQEITAAGRELAEVGRSIQNTEDARTVKAKEFNASLKQLKKNQRDLIEQVNKSEELREIMCQEILDFEAGVVRINRLDTNEEIRTRPMTEEEKQLNFKLTAVDGAKAEKDKKKGTAGAAPQAADAGGAV